MAYQSGAETSSQQQNHQQQRGVGFVPSLYQLRLPQGTSESWGARLDGKSATGFAVGAAIVIGATSIAREAEKEAQAAEVRNRAELERKQREEEWQRVNGTQRDPEKVSQERGRHGETKAETYVAQEDARKRIATAGSGPGASLAEREYARRYGNRPAPDKDHDKERDS